MPSEERTQLVQLVSLLNRLLHPRYRNLARVKYAHYVLRRYADEFDIENAEDWCDTVLLSFLEYE